MNRTTERPSRSSDLDDARNELFSHIHRCAVLKATSDQQVEWMQDTVEFLGERYPSLSEQELDELKAIGLRFCSPVIANGATVSAAHDAVVVAETEDERFVEEANAA